MENSKLVKTYDSIDDVICDYLDQKSQKTTEERGNNYWGASGLGHCKRLQYFQRKGETISNGGPYKWKNNAEDGHLAHYWRQRAIEFMGVLVKDEGEIIIEDLHYRGHFDLVVMLADGLTLCDIKNQNSKAYKDRQKIPGKVLPDHKRQLGSYFVFLRKIMPELKNARMYYVNRDTGEREEIIVLFTEEYLKDIIKELEDLNYYWDNNILPPKEVDKVFCEYVCKYKDTCKQSGNVQKRLPNKVPAKNKPVPVVPIAQEQDKSIVRTRR